MIFFDRKIELTIGSKIYKYPNFTINFKVPHTISDNLDVVEIEIYNLNKNNSIKRNDEVILNAGYGGNLGNIFTGYVNRVYNEWSGLDKVTTIFATEIPNNIRNKTAKKTYKNHRTSAIINDLCKLSGLKIGSVKPASNKLQKDYSVDGNVLDEIKKLSNESNSTMYIRDGKLYVKPSKTSNKSGVVLNAKTGLIGSPEIIENDDGVEYKVNCLLNYAIKKDTWIRVQSREVKGDFRVKEVTHNSSFITEVILV